jgi:DNA-binding response OmpR family regulator
MTKILIVEDDANLRKLLVSELNKKNVEVFEAEDGEQGMAKIVDDRPDVILLDLLLPKLDGFKVLERLRSYPDQKIADTHVVILSNLWSDKDILQAKALKIDHYFVKANSKIEEVVQKVMSLK